MNVIGIVQTDLNEFDVLFEPDPQQNQGGSQGQSQGTQQIQCQEDDSLFFNFLGNSQSSSGQQNQNGQEQNGRNQNGQKQNGPQELTVRIKGIPEGQKATFLQLYQIITDAKCQQDLERSLTIVNREDDQGDQGQNQQQ